MKKFFCNGKKGFCYDTDICANCEFCDNSGGKYNEVPVTNADRIRAMSDEELAKEMCSYSFAIAAHLSEKAWLDWLQQPVEEE